MNPDYRKRRLIVVAVITLLFMIGFITISALLSNPSSDDPITDAEINSPTQEEKPETKIVFIGFENLKRAGLLTAHYDFTTQALKTYVELSEDSRIGAIVLEAKELSLQPQTDGSYYLEANVRTPKDTVYRILFHYKIDSFFGFKLFNESGKEVYTTPIEENYSDGDDLR